MNARLHCMILASASFTLASSCGGGGSGQEWSDPPVKQCGAYGHDGVWNIEVEAVTVFGGELTAFGFENSVLHLDQWADNLGDEQDPDGVDECSVAYFVDSPEIFFDAAFFNMPYLFFAAAGLDNFGGTDDTFMLIGNYYYPAQDITVSIIGTSSETTVVHSPSDWSVLHSYETRAGFAFHVVHAATNEADDDGDGAIDESDETMIYLSPDGSAPVVGYGTVQLRFQR